MRKRIMFSLLVGVIVANYSFAEEYATKAQAETMVKKAVAHMKAVGKDKAFEDFSNRKGDFVNLDLYVTVYNMNADVMAHGQNKKSVGKNMIDLKDPDGKEFVRERMEMAKHQNKFWQEYKFTDPVTKKVLPKEMYCETAQSHVVCAGVYKR